MFLMGVNEKLDTLQNENLSRFLIVTTTFFSYWYPIVMILKETLPMFPSFIVYK